MKDKEYSKNKLAQETVGLRNNGKPGQPLFAPIELGYACPICDNEQLQFSEYASFMYCEKCNLDIPSCFCVKYGQPNIGQDIMPPKIKIQEATRIFLESIKDARKKCLDARKCPWTEEEHEALER